MQAAVRRGEQGAEVRVGGFREAKPGRLVEYCGRAGEGGDHQAVPVGEDFVVAAGAWAGGTRREEDVSLCGEGGFGRCIAGRGDAAEDGFAFPVALWCYVVGGDKR